MSSLNLFKAITESKLILYTEPSAAELRASSRKRMENKRAHANEPREGGRRGENKFNLGLFAVSFFVCFATTGFPYLNVRLDLFTEDMLKVCSQSTWSWQAKRCQM